METEEGKSKEYLEELYRRTGGDTDVQVSMYEVGIAIGLEKSEAGSLAEELMVQGQTELRTLAGGISITVDGLATLGIAVAAPQSAERGFQLSKGPVAEDADRRTMQLLTEKIRKGISGVKLDYDLLEEIVLDLKTIEVQMLSPKPKIAILREIVRSLHAALETAHAGETAAQLRTVL